MEGYVDNKVKGMNDIVYYALIDNVWFILALVGLEVAGMSYYLWHYRHDVAFRFWHVWVFILLFVMLVLTDEEWLVISHDDSWYSFANISKGVVLVGFLGTTATYFFNRKKREKEEYESKIDNRRKEYAKTIVDGLAKVENLTGSYAIGICGGWGSGKTTFLKEIESQLKERHFDIRWFNAWDCSSEQNISSDFFAMLRAAIRPYCSSLDQSIFDYEAALADVGVPTFLQKLANWIVGNKGLSIYDLKVQIRRALVKTGHDVYIIIDDLDRMEAGEILEVLKLIRNNADFPHLKFIVAYDKMYVTTQIRESTKKEGYLNKIFMAEYFLPKLTGKSTKFDLFSNTLKMIDEKCKNNLYDIITNEDNIQIVESAIGSLRQAEIFSRQFDINYKFVSAEEGNYDFHIYDFFWLELLKIVDSRTYETMDNTPELLFKESKRSSGASFYTLKTNEELKNLQIPNSSLDIIKKLIFDDNKEQSTKRMMYVENYSNYFAMGLTAGKLHQAEFAEYINGYADNEMIIQKVHGWINNGQYKSLLNHIQMIPLKNLNQNQAQNLIMCAIAYCFRVNGRDSYINRLVDNCLCHSNYDNNIANRLIANASDVINDAAVKNTYPLSVAKMMVRVIKKTVEDNKTMLWNVEYCTSILKKNFKSFLEKNNPDASDIFNNEKMLHKIVKGSCRNYTINGHDENDDDEHCHIQYVKDEIIDWFCKHKSKNKKCIDEHKKEFGMEIVRGDSYEYDFNHEGYAYEIESIFGSFEVFNDFKEKCFEEDIEASEMPF